MNPSKNDVLASNLLFATLLLSVLGELSMVGLRVSKAHYANLPVTILWGKLLIILTLSVLLRDGLFYAVRRGLLAAKLLLVVFFVCWACTKTDWVASQVAEIDFAHLWGYPLLVLFRNLLTLAALVLMFTKPQQSAIPSSG
jgi:hypothetical protein